MRPADLGAVASIGDPRLSPDGVTVAVVVSNADVEANAYRSRIWMVAADGSGRPRPFTSGGERRDSLPRWSPDGSLLAFVSHRCDHGSQIVTLPIASGGEALIVTGCSEDIEALEWSPDGVSLAFVTRSADPDTYGSGVTADEDRPARRVTRFSSRLDGVGWTMDRPSRVFVVDASGESAAREIEGPDPDGSDVAGMCWSPDGTRIAWCQGVGRAWDIDLRMPIVVAPVAGSPGPLSVIAASSVLNRPAWSADGSTIAVVTGDKDDPPLNSHIAVVSMPGADSQTDAVPRILTSGLDRNCAPELANARSPKWVDDQIWFQVEDRGSIHLYRSRADTDAVPEAVVSGDVIVSGFDVVGATIVYTAVTPDSPGELFVLEGSRGRPLSQFNMAFCERVTVRGPQHFEVAVGDNEVVDAWYQGPTGPDRGATLLNIHGGPFSQYTGSFFDEFAIQAGAGYGVLWCNPRGSSGRSEGWGRAIRGPKCSHDPGSGWGSVDADDVIAVLDAAIGRFSLEPTRIGVLGGSYGGYLTSWLIGHTHRFAAACSERAVNNQLTMVWTSDIGTTFQRGYVGVSHLEDPGEYLRMSPVTYAEAITTPVLILHSESDLRCPISQAEELWVALRLLERDVEFVRFPGSSHGLSRNGPPRQRVRRSEIILDFFDRHLPPAGSREPTRPIP